MATLVGPTDFAGLANGSAWPSPWTTVAASGGSIADVQSTSGRLLSLSGASTYVPNAYAIASPTSVNWDVLFDLSVPSLIESYFNVTIRGSAPSGAGNYPVTGYFLRIMPQFSVYDLNRWTGSNGWVLLSADSVAMQTAMTASTPMRFRLQMLSTTLRMRNWLPANAEPATWAASVTDATVSTAGQFSMTSVTGGTGTTAVTGYFDNILGTDNGTPTVTNVTLAKDSVRSSVARMRAATW